MSSTPESTPRAITADEKVRLVETNRDLLAEDLLSRRLEFESRPRLVHFQFSNFCNMSCTMCYDGNNPPLERMEDEVAERVAAELFPTASLVSPFAGSEPLILTWDITRQLAEQYRVELALITNVQFLDEKKFFELEPHVSKLTFSVDSHMLDVYERIRLRSRPKKVFANLPRAAELCLEHGIEPVANVVFMVENAAFLEETVAFLADQGCKTVRILEYRSIEGNTRSFSDAHRHMSPEWVDWKLGQLRAVAKEKSIRLVYDGREHFDHDWRPKDLEFRPSPAHDVALSEPLRLYYPGYCVQSVDSVQINADGTVYPCCASGEKLALGNLNEQTFDEIWNGPESRDLRRAMLTDDLPIVCRQCTYHTAWIHDELPHLPVVDWFHDVYCGGTVERVPAERHVLEVAEPAHLTRTAEAPRFSWTPPPGLDVARYCVVIARAGSFNDDNLVLEAPADATELEMDEETWSALDPNVAYWWTVWSLGDDLSRSVRAPTVRALIRHEPIPRISGTHIYD